MTASYLWTYLISCWIKILYDNLNKIKRRVCHKLMIHPLLVYPGNIATLMTPSLRFSKTSYASSILESGKRWVIRGVVSIFPWAIKSRISPQSHPSTPPVLKMRFLPYISGSGSICGLSYMATMVTMALGRAQNHA